MVLRNTLTIALLGVLLLATSSNAETTEDSYTIDLYFYGQIDNQNGNITTFAPQSSNATSIECPQEGNRETWPQQQRQWQTVGTWEVDFLGPGIIYGGDYNLTLWAEAEEGSVDDVQFRVTFELDREGNAFDVVLAEGTSQTKTLSEEEDPKDFNIDLEFNSTESFIKGEEMSVTLEYSGGETGQNPVESLQNPEDAQIVVLTSSVDYPAGISSILMSTVSSDFPEIDIQESEQNVFVRVNTSSAFGNTDIDGTLWTLGVIGDSSGDQGMTVKFGTKTSLDNNYEVTFYWYYNEEKAISDTYSFYLITTDIRGNQWKVVSEEDIHLVIHEFEVDNGITPGDIAINNQTGLATVKAGNSFTIDITVHVGGDPLIEFNPIQVSIMLVTGANEQIIYETMIFKAPISTIQTSFRYTFEKEGEYRIKVVIDKSNWVKESDETNNVAEFLLLVSEPKEEDFVQSIIENAKDSGAMTIFIALSVALIVMATLYFRKGEEIDFEWEDDDEF